MIINPNGKVALADGFYFKMLSSLFRMISLLGKMSFRNIFCSQCISFQTSLIPLGQSISSITQDEVLSVFHKGFFNPSPTRGKGLVPTQSLETF